LSARRETAENTPDEGHGFSSRALEFLYFRSEVDDISSREAPLDAAFWLCIRARLQSCGKGPNRVGL